MPKVSEVCTHVRSKNAGPFWITLDLWFPDASTYARYADAPQFKEPKRLFALPAMRGNFPEEAPWLAKYDVAADGQKFVFVRTLPK